MKVDASWPRGLDLCLDEVRVSRGGTDILKGINVCFETARRHVILGASGAGKSTLIRLLNRLEEPTSGLLRLGDQPLNRLPVAVIRRNVGLVFQAPRPLPGSVAENLAYPSDVRGLARPSRVDLARSLNEVGLDVAWLDRDATVLSGGERQRLAIAMALQADPEFLVLDEPTSALDNQAAQGIARLLTSRVEATGLRTITVTHNREYAPLFGDWAIVLGGGRVVDAGPCDAVLSRIDVAAWVDSSVRNAVS